MTIDVEHELALLRELARKEQRAFRSQRLSDPDRVLRGPRRDFFLPRRRPIASGETLGLLAGRETLALEHVQPKRLALGARKLARVLEDRRSASAAAARDRRRTRARTRVAARTRA